VITGLGGSAGIAAPYPFEHLLVLGVLWIVDGFQETGVSPDTTAVFGGTGPFAREADRVALPLVQRQDLLALW